MDEALAGRIKLRYEGVVIPTLGSLVCARRRGEVRRVRNARNEGIPRRGYAEGLPSRSVFLRAAEQRRVDEATRRRVQFGDEHIVVGTGTVVYAIEGPRGRWEIRGVRVACNIHLTGRIDRDRFPSIVVAAAEERG